jgi:hypothetical protein
MLTSPLITAVAEQHRRDLMTQTGPASWAAPPATADPADPSRSSRPRRLADLVRTLERTVRQRPLPSYGTRMRTGKKVRHGN